MEKKQQAILTLCIAYAIWLIGANWTSTLINILQWRASEALTVVEIGNIQAFGSFCNVIGAFFLGQLVDTTGPKTVFVVSAIVTAIYYTGLSLASSWMSFLLVQLFRIGYQFEVAAEMYLATATTEKERTQALMKLTIPQSFALFVGPFVGAQVAHVTSVRVSEFLAGLFLLIALIPTVIWLMPNTHSVPKLASAQLRPQDYWPMVSKNKQLREGILLRMAIVAPYVSFDLAARQFLLRPVVKTSEDFAGVLLTMGAALVFVQMVLLPPLQHRLSPRRLLQIALANLIGAYIAANFCHNYFLIVALACWQIGSYTIAYAEVFTQITSSVERSDMGKATGLASVGNWTVYCIIPIVTTYLSTALHYTYAFHGSVLVTAAALAYVSAAPDNANTRIQNVLPVMTMT